MAITISCPCGKQLRTKEENAGKKLRCPACQSVVTVPAIDDGDSESQNYGLSQDICSCPKCNTEVGPDAVICVQCGYNFKSGKALKTKFKPSTISTRYGFFQFLGSHIQVDISRSEDGKLTGTETVRLFCCPIRTREINLKKFDHADIDVKLGSGGEGLLKILAMFLFWRIRLDKYIVTLHGPKQKSIRLYWGFSQAKMHEMVEMLRARGIQVEPK